VTEISSKNYIFITCRPVTTDSGGEWWLVKHYRNV